MESNARVEYKYTPVAILDRGDNAPTLGDVGDETESKVNIYPTMVSAASHDVSDSNNTSRRFLYLAACIG